MRRVLLSALVLGFLLVPAVGVRAADEPAAVIDKAIKAYGGADKLNQNRGVESTGKGTIDAAGGIKFTREARVQKPDRLKEVLEMEVGGQKVAVTTVYDGKNLWINANGMEVPVSDPILAEVKEQLYEMEVGRLTSLKDKKYELSPLGEAKVDGEDAVGVRVSSKGHRDINLFFSKKSGLAIKTERRALEPMSGQEYTQVKILSDFRPLDGIQIPRKVVMYRDDKKIMELEVTGVKFVDKFDDSTFAKP